MDVGREIIREQLFFRKELRERVYWFIKLRWAAGVLGAAGLAAAWLLALPIPLMKLAAVVCFILACNLLFQMIGRRLKAHPPAATQPFHVFAHVQISLDLLALFLMVLLTGGLTSPLVIFFVFHVGLAGILLSPFSCYLYATIISLSLALLVGGHGLEWIGSWPGRIAPGTSGPAFNPHMIVSLFLANAAGLMVAAFLISSVKSTLLSKGRQLMKISRELTAVNAKLKSLYDMTKEIGKCPTPQALMDTATRRAAGIMGVKACSLKLLDQEQGCLRFASTYGLSEDYTAKDCVSLKESAINRRIVEGFLYTIGNVDDTDYFQYPEDVRREGIASMLCLPLKVDNNILGVFCVYSGQAYFFQDEDSEFFALMTDLTALALERLQRDMVKTWFMNKAAHQLRSPLNTLQSMLHVLEGGYLGSLSDQQKETVGRCQKRLSILQDTINDLLKLATERKIETDRRFQPVDVTEAILALEPMYRTQATRRDVVIEFLTPGDLPPVLAQEKLIDELLTNLISNAIKYTPAGGRVTVGLSEFSPELVLLEVRDTGIGIPEADQARLFTEFFRAENARNMAEEGTGLGLVIVKEILNIIGGTIRIESKVRQGTRISCLLPTVHPDMGNSP